MKGWGISEIVVTAGQRRCRGRRAIRAMRAMRVSYGLSEVFTRFECESFFGGDVVGFGVHGCECEECRTRSSFAVGVFRGT